MADEKEDLWDLEDEGIRFHDTQRNVWRMQSYPDLFAALLAVCRAYFADKENPNEDFWPPRSATR